MHKTFFTITIIITDLTVFLLSLFIAVEIRTLLGDVTGFIPQMQLEFKDFLELYWMPMMYIFFLTTHHLYRKRLPLSDEIREIIKVAFISLVVIFAIVSLGKIIHQVSRLTLMIHLVLLILIHPPARYWVKRILYKLKIGTENIIILGAGQAGEAVLRELDNEKNFGYRPVGFLDDTIKSDKTESAMPVIGSLNEYANIQKKFRIQTAVIAIPSLERSELSALVARVQKYTKRVLIVPDMSGVALLNAELYHLFAEQLFLIKIRNNLQSFKSRAVKRTFDLVMSVLMAPFLLPAMLVLAVLIKLDSKGPVFYRQRRIGRNGHEVKVIKFRSMFTDADERLKTIIETDVEAKREWEQFYKLKNDPRITKIGNFLRKTSLDELPQLFNVFTGSMSLVGPRPVLQKEIDQYYKDEAQNYYLVRPGITGLWQVSGRNNMDYEQRVMLDSWYVLNWSLWFDLIILFKTIKVVIRQEGAY